MTTEAKSLRSVRNIAHLTAFADTLPPAAIMVEVGSWIGESARVFAPRVRQLLCVDSWQRGEAIYDAFVSNVKPYPNLSWLRMTSTAAAALIADRSLTAVYIDAAHDYASVRADILAWAPKIVPGGILAGHDYGPHAPGVVQAVDELFGRPSKVYGETTWRA